MSYVRWSSVWPDPFDSTAEYLEACYPDGKYQGTDAVLKAAQSKNPRTELSNWYIFWHSHGGSDSETETRQDQFLAMWQAGHEQTPVLPYHSVKYMYEKDHWDLLGYTEIAQKDLLRHCVARWLRDVEAEYHD